MNYLSCFKQRMLCFAACTALLFTGAVSMNALAIEPRTKDDLCSYTITKSGNKMRYCRNRALSSSNDAVRRAVIVIPGSGSNAKEYYYDKLLPNVPKGVLNDTNIIVPQFLEDTGEPSTILSTLQLSSDYLYWTGGWRQCNSARNNSGFSSCEMVDFIVEKLIQYNRNLEHIVIIGHSAGAQFVNRFAAASNIEAHARGNGVSISYAASAPGSYVFVADDRPKPEEGCDGFNKWKFGLDNRNSYANDFSVSTMKQRLIGRKIYYFVGDEDTDTSTNCKENVQGATRIERMENYKRHLLSACRKMNIFNPLICQTKNIAGPNAFKILPGIGHNSEKLLKSDHALNIMYSWD